MGFKFRKRIKIAPGIKLNITSKGISSVSLGGKGATLNVGKNGTKATTSIPGTGLSYTQNFSSAVTNSTRQATEQALAPNQPYLAPQGDSPEKKVSLLLGLGIFVMPYLFAWALLQSGYSKRARYISFGWLAWFAFIFISRKP